MLGAHAHASAMGPPPQSPVSGVEVSTEPNMGLEARVCRRLKDKWGEDDANEDDDSDVVLDFPKGTITDTINGESVQKYRREDLDQWVYEVRFNLNGIDYKVDTEVSSQFLESAGDKNTFVAALVDGMSKEITKQLIEKLSKACRPD